MGGEQYDPEGKDNKAAQCERQTKMLRSFEAECQGPVWKENNKAARCGRRIRLGLEKEQGPMLKSGRCAMRTTSPLVVKRASLRGVQGEQQRCVICGSEMTMMRTAVRDQLTAR